MGGLLLKYALTSGMPFTAAYTSGVLRKLATLTAAIAPIESATGGQVLAAQPGQPGITPADLQQSAVGVAKKGADEVHGDDDGHPGSSSSQCDTAAGTCLQEAGCSGSKDTAKELQTWFEYTHKPDTRDTCAAAAAGSATQATGQGAVAAQAAGAPWPLDALHAAAQVMALLLLMYVLLHMTAAVAKGRPPLRELLRMGQSIRTLFQVMLAPLCMMLIGWLITMAQYGLNNWRAPPRRAAAAAPCLESLAAAG
jgi:hypothetical protein